MKEETDLNGDTVPAIALLCMQQMSNDAAHTYNALYESVQNENDLLKAELTLIKGQIRRLCEGPYAPNPLAILDSLYPDSQAVNEMTTRFRAERESEMRRYAGE